MTVQRAGMYPAFPFGVRGGLPLAALQAVVEGLDG
jgi:hypothetical protein